MAMQPLMISCLRTPTLVHQAHQAPLKNQYLEPHPPNTNKNHTPTVTQHNPDNHLLHNNESTLNAAINLLNLNSRIVPPTPTNSLASTNSNSGNHVAANPVDPNLHAIYPTIQQNQPRNTVEATNFSSRPPWIPPKNSNLNWAWIGSNGPFITNGQRHSPCFEASDTESDTTTIQVEASDSTWIV